MILIVSCLDGRTYDPDVIILCTGYIQKHPFMAPNLTQVTVPQLHPDHLYKV